MAGYRPCYVDDADHLFTEWLRPALEVLELEGILFRNSQVHAARDESDVVICYHLSLHVRALCGLKLNSLSIRRCYRIYEDDVRSFGRCVRSVEWDGPESQEYESDRARQTTRFTDPPLDSQVSFFRDRSLVKGQAECL